MILNVLSKCVQVLVPVVWETFTRPQTIMCHAWVLHFALGQSKATRLKIIPGAQLGANERPEDDPENPAHDLSS